MKKFFLYIIALFLFTFNSYSQSGIKFPELAKRIEPYFDNALIDDLKEQLPQGSEFNIWGYDIGDFSGDGNNDIAMSIRLSGDRSRKMYVYLFADIDGFLQKVGQYIYDFVELPLEIGVVIRDNKCIVTKKNKQYDWIMDAYSFDNGSLIKSEVFATRRISDLTYEKIRNYIELTGSDKYIQTKNGKEIFFRKYLILPSYYRGKKFYKGYNAELVSDNVDYIPVGAYYWKGEDDCSFKASSAYDENYLYFTIDISDDIVVTQNCDTCICDMVDVWLDVNNDDEENRFLQKDSKDSKIKFRESAQSGIFKFSIFPGNFTDKEAYVKIATSDDISVEQKTDSKLVKAISNLNDNGYIVKFKIPFSLLGLIDIPLKENKQIELGCTIIVNDYDNEFRPEELTQIMTSSFSPFNPSSYGSLILVPKKEWFGESVNIYTEDIVKNLLEYGF